MARPPGSADFGGIPVGGRAGSAADRSEAAASGVDLSPDAVAFLFVEIRNALDAFYDAVGHKSRLMRAIWRVLRWFRQAGILRDGVTDFMTFGKISCF